jgi:outer membrane protein assembly factor BamE (lipoprotein component of BamABCDE complex)
MSINKKIFFIAIFTITISACSNLYILNETGNMPRANNIEKIIIGETNEKEVLKILGSPSTINKFNDKSYIYMSSKIKSIAFFKPEEIERNVLTIEFNKNNTVSKISRLNKQDGKEINISLDKTPTTGKELTVWEQIIGNIGRFNQPLAR